MSDSFLIFFENWSATCCKPMDLHHGYSSK